MQDDAILAEIKLTRSINEQSGKCEIIANATFTIHNVNDLNDIQITLLEFIDNMQKNQQSIIDNIKKTAE